MRRDTARRRALFASAWGFNAGLLYSGFFGNLVEPVQTDSGNWNMPVLTVLVGLACATAVVGTVATIAMRGSAGSDVGQKR
jgi:hypothetical protein